MTNTPQPARAVGKVFEKSSQPVEGKNEWKKKNDIFDSAEKLGALFIEACGNTPSIAAMEALYSKGYIDYSPTEILGSGVFHDWADFQNFAQLRFDTDKQTAAEKRQEIMREVYSQIEAGKLPSVFLADFKKTESSENSDPNNQVELSGELGSQETILKRYARYKIAGVFPYITVSDTGGRRLKDPEKERLHLAIGININTGAPIGHTFINNLIAGNPSLDKQQIENSAIYNDWYEYLHPEARKIFLRELRDAAFVPDYYYQIGSRIVYMVGQHSNPLAYIENDKFLKWLYSRNKLVPRQQLSDQHLGSKMLCRLGELILTDDLAERGIRRTEKRIAPKLPREAYLDYGRFLISVIRAQNSKARLSKKIISNAHTLGIGFSHDQVKRRFGSVGKFAYEIGEKNAGRHGLFSEYGIEDFSKKIAELGEKLGRKPSNQDVDEEARTNHDFPGTNAIRARGFNMRQVYDAAGWPDIRKWEKTDHEMHGVRFMMSNNAMMPTKKAWDYVSKQKRGPSSEHVSGLYKRGFVEYKQRVLKLYNKALKGKVELTEKDRNIIKAGQLSVPPEFSKRWNQRALVLYGLKFMIANNGLPPSMVLLDYLSQQKKGPSATTIKTHFPGLFTEYKKKVTKLYCELMSSSGTLAWINDESINILKLPEEMMTPKRKKLIVGSQKTR